MAQLGSDPFSRSAARARPATRARRANRARGQRSHAAAHLFVCLFLSAALLVLSRVDHALVTSLRAGVSKTVLPVTRFAAAPADAVRTSLRQVQDAMVAGEQLAALRQENLELRQWKWRAAELEQQIKELAAQARVTINAPRGYVTGRIVADATSPFQRTVLLDVGAQSGVEVGHPVVNAAGLVGRIITVRPGAARVLLATDPSSRIPVTLAGQNWRAILSGRRAGGAEIIFMREQRRPPIGAAVLTSGDGGIFPPGLPVGQVIGFVGDTPLVRVESTVERAAYASVLLDDAVARQISDGIAAARERREQRALTAPVAPFAGGAGRNAIAGGLGSPSGMPDPLTAGLGDPWQRGRP